MSLSETMTELMDAARVKFPLVSKLTIFDLKRLLLSKVVSDETIQMADATVDGEWQKIPLDSTDNPYQEYQLYPFGDLGYVSAKKGETIYQAITLKTDGSFRDTLISFYQKDFGHHNVATEVEKIDDRTVRISASYTCDADGEYLLQDLNLLHILNGTYVAISDCYAAISPVGGVVNLVLTAAFEGRCAA